jgi:hypothetical protein
MQATLGDNEHTGYAGNRHYTTQNYSIMYNDVSGALGGATTFRIMTFSITTFSITTFTITTFTITTFSTTTFA